MRKKLLVRQVLRAEQRWLENRSTWAISVNDTQLLKKIETIVRSNKEMPVKEIVTRVHVHPTTVRRWIHKFNSDGVDLFRHRPRSGRPRKANSQLETLVMGALAKSPAEFGCNARMWNGRVLHEHLQRVTGLTISLRTVYNIINRLKPK